MKLLLDGNNSPDWLIDYIKTLLEQDNDRGFTALNYIKEDHTHVEYGRLLRKAAAEWFNQQTTKGPLTGCTHIESLNKLEFEFEETPELTMLILQHTQ
jgi:hypothetical protein